MTSLEHPPSVPFTVSGKMQAPLNIVPDKSDEQPAPNYAYGGANGVNGGVNGQSTTKMSRFDPHFTDAVINAGKLKKSASNLDTER